MKGLINPIASSLGVEKYVSQFMGKQKKKKQKQKNKAERLDVELFPKDDRSNNRTPPRPEVTNDPLRIKMQKWKAVQHERLVNPQTAEDIKAKALIEYMGPDCPYCQSQAEIKTAKEYKGIDKPYCYWVCPSCDNVSVTTSGKTYMPSGILANGHTRRMRGEVQELLKVKKGELNNDRFALNKWIQDVLHVDADQAWVGQLTNTQLATLARCAQKDKYKKTFAYIFNTTRDDA